MSFHLDRRAPDLAQRVADYPGDHLLTVDELAAWLAVHPGTVTRWHQSGVGPKAVRAGLRAVRFRKDDVKAWLEERALARAEG